MTMVYKEGPCRRCRAPLKTKGLCDRCAAWLLATLLVGHVKAPCLACHKYHAGLCMKGL